MLIGITGKSGVGKSKVSECISQRLENCKVICVDSLLQECFLKQKKLIKLLDRNIIVDNNINVSHLLQNKEKYIPIFRKIYKPLDVILIKKIKLYQKIYNSIILDFYILQNLPKIWDKCDYKILVDILNDQERYERIISRNAETSELYQQIGPNIKMGETIDEEIFLRDFDLPDYYESNYDYYFFNDDRKNFNGNVDLLIKDLKRKYK